MPGAAERGGEGEGDRGVGRWKFGRCRWEGPSGWRERVGVKGESLGRLSGRRREGERKGKQEDLGTEGGRGLLGEWGLSLLLGLSFKPPANPAGILKILHQGHISPSFKMPVQGGFLMVRSSEPAVGTYPHNRFHDHNPCPCEHTCPVYLQKPIISVSLSDPWSIVTELTLPPTSSRHPQTYRCYVPFLNL